MGKGQVSALGSKIGMTYIGKLLQHFVSEVTISGTGQSTLLKKIKKSTGMSAFMQPLG